MSEEPHYLGQAKVKLSWSGQARAMPRERTNARSLSAGLSDIWGGGRPFWKIGGQRLMMSNMNKVDHNNSAPADWVDALERSKAQIDAGETVPSEPVLQRMRDRLARLEAIRSKSS